MIQSGMLVGGLIGVGLAALPPEPAPLQVVVVDDSTFPTISLDVVPPRQLAADQLTAAMVTVGGDPVSSLEVIDPASTAVAVVIDDRPDLADDAVQAAQGAAVELARNLGVGTQVAVFTPSGLQTVLTEDKNAAIARVSGIVAGAPDVVALPQVLLAGTEALQTARAPDRHLVVLLGADLALDDAQRAQLGSAVDAAGARLHLVTSGPAPTALSEIARATGGTDAASTVQTAGADQVTTAIVERYRAVVTVGAAGPQEVVLDVGGERLTTNVDVVPPAAPPAPPVETTAGAAGPAVTTAVTDAAPPPSNTVASGPPSSAPSSVGLASSVPAATDAGESDDGAPVSAILLSALLLAVAAVVLVVVWRPKSGRRATAPAAGDPKASDEPVEPASSAAPVEFVEPASSAAPVEPVEPVAAVLPVEPVEPVAAVLPVEPVAAVVPVEPASPVVRVDPEVGAAPEVEDPAAVVPELAEHDARPSPAPQVSRSPVADPRLSAVRHDRPVDKRRTARQSAGRPAGHPVRAASLDESTNDDWIESGALRMSPSTGEVWRGRRRLSLTAAETDVLHLLLTQRDRGLTAEEILQAAGRSPDEGPRAAELVVARVGRRVGLGAGRGQAVRKERSIRYYFDV